MKKVLVGSERTCANCGDQFLMQEGWKYKRSKAGKTHVFCSWGCMKDWDFKNRRYPVRERRDLMVQMIREGLTNGEIMVNLGYSYEEIDRCRKRLEVEESGGKKHEYASE